MWYPCCSRGFKLDDSLQLRLEDKRYDTTLIQVIRSGVYARYKGEKHMKNVVRVISLHTPST